MIFRWLHNRKYKNNPMCPCKWRMVSVEHNHHDNYWICKWEKCKWEAFSTTSGKTRWGSN